MALKETTYNSHILDEQTRTEAEVRHLQLVSEAVREVIIKPRFIYYDVNYEGNLRHKYIDLICLEELLHIQALVVVVDTDREPNEVVTWTIKRSLNKEIIRGGRLVYDARKHSGKI